MRKNEIQRRPPYPVESVDNALRLIQLLRDEGTIRLTTAANELGIAPSTAHRLMSMLVYRGFALQGDDREYVAGPAIGARAVGGHWTRELRKLLQPNLELLSSRIDETVNLMVRVGVSVRFLTTVEARALIHIGDRGGAVVPAKAASGGKVLLATESPEWLERMYCSAGARAAGHALDAEEFAALLADLRKVRAQGYATNVDETEEGVGAVGMPLSLPSGRSIASFSVSVPTQRMKKLLEPQLLSTLFATRDEMNAAIEESGLEQLS